MSSRGPDRRRAARRLEDHERMLFEQVMRSVDPLHNDDRAHRPAMPSPVPAPRPVERPAPQLPRQSDFTPDVAPIDRRTARKLERGRMPIEARLDLHGDDQVTAHMRLNRFVVSQAQSGKRCVLVITGKGAVGESRYDRPQRGVLRRQVPMWLASPELRPYVSGLRGAAQPHGGAGAYYLILRKPK